MEPSENEFNRLIGLSEIMTNAEDMITLAAAMKSDLAYWDTVSAKLLNGEIAWTDAMLFRMLHALRRTQFVCQKSMEIFATYQTKGYADPKGDGSQ